MQQIKTALYPSKLQMNFASSILRSVCHPFRIGLVNYITDNPMVNQKQIVEHFEMKFQSQASEYLSMLEDSGVLKSSYRIGAEKLYTVNNETLLKIHNAIKDL